ncbi:methyltransferase [Bacteroides faecis]|nr:methyltransferase [Bacteroides faecis]KAA5272262.1 methyltransferase [Bacteroides faecis]KAA5278057.1 methyltransferase [Bacteroides faecis]KAA5283144.1 methyltransferase [Bacteroides faecis]KAA5296162.1 methyltransferase [Bacteroides faecis]
MNQQEIRSKYYLHSDVFHPESTGFFFFLQKRYFSSLVMR